MSATSPSTLAGRKVLVMGLGRFGGGVGVAQWLAQQGAHVTVTDAAKSEDLADSIKALDGLPITFRLGGHDVADFLAADLIVINPAVDRAKSDVVQAALKKGVPTTTEMNLFLERCPARAIGITGSVGKSTTTALIYEALKAALKSGQWSVVGVQSRNSDHRPLTTDHSSVFLGGNIGRSLLLDLPSIRPHDLVVLELSSFMLEETPTIQWSPHIAVVTNVFPNHLDRHGTMAAYSAAKQNILRFQRPDDIAILNADHELVARWTHFAKGKVIRFTTRGPASRHINMLMPGMHNQSNAAAAIAVVDALAAEGATLDRPSALQAIAQYPGLPHRLQCVHAREISPGDAGVPTGAPARTLRFYNDSKATSPDASITALEAFPPRTAIFIVGGYDKHIDMSAFQTLLAERAGGVLGIGQTGRAMIEGVAGVPGKYTETLDRAVALAIRWAEGDGRIEAIVLSPASASWGQFANYEQRGEVFSQLAKKLPDPEQSP